MNRKKMETFKLIEKKSHNHNTPKGFLPSSIARGGATAMGKLVEEQLKPQRSVENGERCIAVSIKHSLM